MKAETLLCAERNLSPLFDLVLIRKTLEQMKIFFTTFVFFVLFFPSCLLL